MKILVPVFCILSSAALAAATGGALSERYRESLQELESNRASEEQTRAERDRFAAEVKDLQERLIANAAKVQEIETAYAGTQAELVTLNQNMRVMEADLEKDRDRVAHLLAVLQRLDADMPPALAIRPDDSLSAARGAMQLGAVLPPVYAQAAELAKRLKTLTATQAQIAAKGTEAQTEAEALKTARDDLDRLLQLRNRQTDAAGVKLAELHGITEEISKSATDLKVLIERISTIRAQGGFAQGMTVIGPGNAQGTGLNRGSLRWPVTGQFLPGDPAGPGTTPGLNGPSGLWFEGGEGAEVVAPGDSEVVFAGPYQKFGQVLILEIMGGYHLTLAGIGRIDVHIGDRVLAGEPVGILPQSVPARLYLELRRAGQTVDPTPWMGAELRKAKGT